MTDWKASVAPQEWPTIISGWIPRDARNHKAERTSDMWCGWVAALDGSGWEGCGERR